MYLQPLSVLEKYIFKPWNSQFLMRSDLNMGNTHRDEIQSVTKYWQEFYW